MNLLFLIDYINYGLGAERALLNIANSLCDKHNVVIAARFDGGNPSYWMDPRIDYRLLNTERDLPLHKKVFSYLKETQALKRLKKEIQADISISFLETANFLNVVSGGPGKTVISIRNYYSLGLKSDYAFIQRIKAVWSGKTADQVVCVSEMIRQDMVKHFKAPQKKTCVIYNMYNVQQEAVPYREDIYDLFIQRKGGSHSVFITTGRLTVQKGQWHLIRAFKKVHEVIPDAVLFIFGGGSLENYLSMLIRENNLEDSTYLMEFDPGIVHYLKEADIYVSPSLWEGFSNSILEALCNGMPVISTDCHTGPRELLAPDTDYSYETDKIEYAKYGILVPAGSEKRLINEPLTADEELLADAMIALAKHPELREKYARAALERAELFKPELIISQWESLLKTLTQ